MPSLVNLPVACCRQLDESSSSDASETILPDQSLVLLGDESREEFENKNVSRALEIKKDLQHYGGDHALAAADPLQNSDREAEDATVNESATVLSKTLLHDEVIEEQDDWFSGIDLSQKAPNQYTLKADVDHENDALTCSNTKNIRNSLIGPNQSLYQTRYEPYIKSKIRAFDQQHPGLLKEYRNLSPEDQAREQERVLALLSRLGIGKGSQKFDMEQTACQRHAAPSQNMRSPIFAPVDREKLLNETMSPLMSPGCHAPPQLDDDASFFVKKDDSEAIEPSAHAAYGRVPVVDGAARADESVNSSESVELVRAPPAGSVSPYSDRVYESPGPHSKTNPYKRQASTSAKRGADLSRKRYNDDFIPPRPDDASSSDQSIGDAITNCIGRLSISPVGPSPNAVFPASQSPISPKLTHDSFDSDDFSIKDKRSQSHHFPRSNAKASDDTIDSFETLEKANRRSMREIPVNVGMKEGATFHIEKLDIKRSELARLKNGNGGMHRRLAQFPDPFKRYNSKQKHVLNDVFKALCHSEVDSKNRITAETSCANVLFSLSYEQIVDLCLKLFLNDDATCGQNNRFLHSNVSLQGRTVIVVRTKDNTIAWERALRESTGCSVFNHSTAPLSERIRSSTAKKATKFDIILTTFDALKAADTAVPIDKLGYAVLSGPDEAKGWMSSRTSSHSETAQPLKCKELSVLHKVNFQRAIFVDQLGRKSFLAKYGTARAAAAVALRANSRLVFFNKSSADGDSALRALKQSDKRATQSLATILHIQSGQKDASGDESIEQQTVDPLENCMLDLKELL